MGMVVLRVYRNSLLDAGIWKYSIDDEISLKKLRYKKQKVQERCLRETGDHGLGEGGIIGLSHGLKYRSIPVCIGHHIPLSANAMMISPWGTSSLYHKNLGIVWVFLADILRILAKIITLSWYLKKNCLPSLKILLLVSLPHCHFAREQRNLSIAWRCWKNWKKQNHRYHAGCREKRASYGSSSSLFSFWVSSHLWGFLTNLFMKVLYGAVVGITFQMLRERLWVQIFTSYIF